MKNMERENSLIVTAGQNPKRKPVVSVTQLTAALCLLLLLPIFAVADGERFTIDLGDSHIKGFRGNEATIFLKRSLKEQYPDVDVERLELRSVVLIAKTEYGAGRAALRVGKWSTEMYEVAGNPRSFRDFRKGSFDKLYLVNPSNSSRGPWLIDLLGNFVVRKVVLVVDHHRRHEHPRHWYGHRW